MTRSNTSTRPKFSPSALAEYVKGSGPLLAYLLRIPCPYSDAGWSGRVFKRRKASAGETLIQAHRQRAQRACGPYPVRGGLGYSLISDGPTMPLRPDEVGRHADAFADWICGVWDGVAALRSHDELSREAMVEAGIYPGSFPYAAMSAFNEHWLPSVIGVVALMPAAERESWRRTISDYTGLFTRAIDGFMDIALRFGEDEQDEVSASDATLLAEQQQMRKGHGTVEVLMAIVSPMAALVADMASHTEDTPADAADPAFFRELRRQTHDAHMRVVWAGLRALPPLR